MIIRKTRNENRKQKNAVNKIFIYTKGFHDVYQELND